MTDPIHTAPISRRGFVAAAGAAVLAPAIFSRLTGSESPERLVIPTIKPSGTPTYGQQKLELGLSRDGLFYVPKSYRGNSAVPLLLLFHGAGQSSAEWFGSYGRRSEETGMIMLAPDSRGTTWDAVRGEFGPDVAFVNRALAMLFARYWIDPKRIAIAGFSDGASYALSLGLANGDLAPNVIAYSPGFVVESSHHGKPAFFISHGTADNILPIDRTSRPLVANLRRGGYSVEFKEFDGHHEVPPEMSDAALKWLRARQ